jgi:hypothetical protein
MHGGKCTGPRTPQGKARTAAAHTTHGYSTAPRREHQRYIRTLIRRNRLLSAARLLWRYLPPDMAARLAELPLELSTPIHPSNLPFLTPEQARRHNVTAALGRTHPQPGAGRVRTTPPPTVHAYERAALREEAAAQAPWRHAIAVARAAKRADHAAKRAARAAKRADRAARAAKRAARAARRATRAGQGAPPTRTTQGPTRMTRSDASRPAADSARLNHTPTAWPPDPNPPESQLSLLERERAARAAGLRAGRPALVPESAAPGQNPDSTLTGLNPMQREPGLNPHSQPVRLNPMQRETGATAGGPPRKASALTCLTPTTAAALRSTTLAGTWDTELRSTLAARFGRPPSGWRIPQAWPPIAGAGATRTAGCAEACNHARDIPVTSRPQAVPDSGSADIDRTTAEADPRRAAAAAATRTKAGANPP